MIEIWGDDLFQYKPWPEEKIPKKIKVVKELGIKPPLLVDESLRIYRVTKNIEGYKGLYEIQNGVPEEWVEKVNKTIERLKCQ